jgi:hypothetical protein
VPFDKRLSLLVGRKFWSMHVYAWRTRTAPTAIIRFEDLVADPAATLRRGCEEIGVELGEPVGELKPFERLHKRNPMMYRRGVPGAWRDEMPRSVQRRFWRIHGAEMRALGYTDRRRSATDSATAAANSSTSSADVSQAHIQRTTSVASSQT